MVLGGGMKSLGEEQSLMCAAVSSFFSFLPSKPIDCFEDCFSNVLPHYAEHLISCMMTSISAIN